MRKVFASLYWKLSISFLVLLIVLGAWMYQGFYLATIRVKNKTEQRMHGTTAQQLAVMLQPKLETAIDQLAVLDLLDLFQKLNPNCAVYILDQKGKIIRSLLYLKALTPIVPIIDLQSVHRFLDAPLDSNFLVLGTDPVDPSEPVAFTAATVTIAGEPGYVYVVPNHKYRMTFVRGVGATSAGFDMLLMLGVGVLITTGLGMLILFAVTKKFYRITAIVDRFRSGDFSARISVAANDEVGMLAQSIDQMAERIEANIEQLSQKDALRRQLVSNISHDLRGPVTSISGYAETLTAQIDDALLRDKCLTGINQNTSFLKQLIAELFELSKFEAQDLVPKLEPFFSDRLIENAAVTFEPIAAERGVSVIAVAQSLPPVIGDEEMLQRVILNLTDNAVRHTDSGGRVEISAELIGSAVKFSVSDTGKGIASEDIGRIFTRWYQVQNKAMPKGSGSGLGLAIVKKILDAHAAEIKVESEIGRGTVFYFTLPVAPADSVDESATE